MKDFLNHVQTLRIFYEILNFLFSLVSPHRVTATSTVVIVSYDTCARYKREYRSVHHPLVLMNAYTLPIAAL